MVGAFLTGCNPLSYIVDRCICIERDYLDAHAFSDRHAVPKNRPRTHWTARSVLGYIWKSFLKLGCRFARAIARML
jgi:hypothetical protein